MKDGSDAVSDWPLLNALLNTASGATWVVSASRRRRRHGLSRSTPAWSSAADGTDDPARTPRARALERPGDRRHAPRRRRATRSRIDCAKEKGLRLPGILGDSNPVQDPARRPITGACPGRTASGRDGGESPSFHRRRCDRLTSTGASAWPPSLADGPFSIFPGIDRTLSILSGRGMTLEIDALEPLRLTQQSRRFAFAADIAGARRSSSRGRSPTSMS